MGGDTDPTGRSLSRTLIYTKIGLKKQLPYRVRYSSGEYRAVNTKQ